MKYLKMAGLAAVLAMAFMAFGAGTASATTLCTTTPNPSCPAGWEITPTQDSHIVANLTHGELFTTGNTGNPLVTCKKGSLTSTVEDAGSSTTTAKALNDELKFEECSGGTPTVLKAGTMEIHHIPGTHNGTVTVKEAEVTIHLFGVSCTYGAVGAATIDLGILETTTLTVNTVVNKIAGGFLCPNTAGWDTSGHLVGGSSTPSVIYVGA